MRYRPGGEVMTRRAQDQHDSASNKFQRLIDRCMEDGTITRSEAIMLAQQHNDMQEISRKTLKQLLNNHGQSPVSTLLTPKPIYVVDGHTASVRGDSGTQGQGGTRPPMPEPDTTWTTKGAGRGRRSKNWTSGVQILDIEHSKDTLKDILVSAFADKKVRFAMITMPSALLSFLKITGVI